MHAWHVECISYQVGFADSGFATVCLQTAEDVREVVLDCPVGDAEAVTVLEGSDLTVPYSVGTVISWNRCWVCRPGHKR